MQVNPSEPDQLVDRICAAVLSCPAVAGLHHGQFGLITTVLPERRVAGVLVTEAEIVVGVLGHYPVSVGEIAAQVRAAVADVAPGRQIMVNVEDLVLPGEPQPDDRPSSTDPP